MDGDGHADVGEVLLQGDDVLVEQADAALAGAAGDGVLVVGAAMDADAHSAGKDEIDHPRAHYVAAETYLNLGRPDSALYYLNHVPASGMMANHTSDTVMYCRLMSEIAKANKEWDKFTTYYERANEMADSILFANVNKNFLALYCYGFSRMVIMICMKYSSLGTVSNKKIQIAKKLGVNNLDDFVNNYR